jgi:hypothetical protein
LGEQHLTVAVWREVVEGRAHPGDKRKRRKQSRNGGYHQNLEKEKRNEAAMDVIAKIWEKEEETRGAIEEGVVIVAKISQARHWDALHEADPKEVEVAN